MKHIVIAGAGIGGIAAAYEMKELVGKNHRVTVISNTDYFHFVPSNPWVAFGLRQRGDIIISLEKVLTEKNIEFIASGIEKMLPAENALLLQNGARIAYDYLIIATGPQFAFDEIEGFGSENHTYSICHIDHAERTHVAWETFLKNPGPIVVGAVQGASCFGPAYEFALICDAELRERKLRDQVPITFVTSEPYIGHLGLDGVGDTKGLLESALRKRHIKWITNAKVDKFEAASVSVTECDEDGKPKKQHMLPSQLTMMIPAFRGISAFQGIEGVSNPRGFILTDAFQRNPKYSNIYAVGVCVALAPKTPTPVATGVPKTGYMIESMATAAVRNIADVIEGKNPSHKPSLNAVCLADFGDSGVAFVAIPQIPPRNLNWSGSGKWVHWAKEAFEKYFLYKVRHGQSEPVYEKAVLKAMGLERLKPEDIEA